MSEAPIGLELGGYAITGTLASGGFAQVYTAEGPSGAGVLKLGHARGGRPGATAAFAYANAVAIGAGADEPRSVGPSDVDALLLAEAALLTRAEGAAGLPRLLAQVEYAGRPGLILERVPGASLSAARLAGRALSVSAVVDLTRGLADAIAAGHIAAHGDLKPANLIATPSGAVRPIDPGCMTEKVSAATPQFQPLLARSPDGDRLALAACLYAYVSGRAPFATLAPARARGGDRAAWRTFLALQFTPLQPRDDLPAAVIDVVHTAVETAPEPRGVEGLRRLADDLEQVALGGCPDLRPPTRAQASPPV